MERLALPQQIANRDRARLRRYDELLSRFAGTHVIVLGSRRQRVLRVNYARAVVEKGAAYLMTAHRPTVEALPAGGGDVHQARAILEEVWEENDLNLLDVETEVDTGTLGDGAFKVTWDEEEERVVVSAPDVQGLYAWTSGDDARRTLRVAQRWTVDAEDYVDTYGEAPPQRERSAVSNAGIRVQVDTGSREADRESDVEVIESWSREAYERWANGQLVDHRPNPYGVIPFVIYPNLSRPKHVWGISDLEPIAPLLDEIDRLFTQNSRIVELSGNPIAVLENVDSAEGIRVEPGALWTLPEDAKAYLLNLVKDLGGGFHGEHFQAVLQALSDIAEVPRIAYGDSDGNPSGVALAVQLDPLLRRVDRKRLIREGAFRRRNDLILRVAGYHLGIERLHEVATGTEWDPIFDESPGRVPGLTPPPATPATAADPDASQEQEEA